MRSYYETFGMKLDDSMGESGGSELGGPDVEASEQWRTPKKATGGVSSVPGCQ